MPLVEECWGKGPLILLHFDKVGPNGKKKPPGKETYVLTEVGLVCTAVVRIRGHGRDSDSNCCTMKCSLASNFALRIRNQESDGNIEQNRTHGFIP